MKLRRLCEVDCHELAIASDWIKEQPVYCPPLGSTGRRRGCYLRWASREQIWTVMAWNPSALLTLRGEPPIESRQVRCFALDDIAAMFVWLRIDPKYYRAVGELQLAYVARSKDR